MVLPLIHSGLQTISIFDQKLPIGTTHHTFLESTQPTVTKTLCYVLSTRQNQIPIFLVSSSGTLYYELWWQFPNLYRLSAAWIWQYPYLIVFVERLILVTLTTLLSDHQNVLFVFLRLHVASKHCGLWLSRADSFCLLELTTTAVNSSTLFCSLTAQFA